MIQRRLALIGPSGVGKSTVGELITELIPQTTRVAVAQPLRQLETYIYDLTGNVAPATTGKQDGRLLQICRDAIEHVSPAFLESDFERRVMAASNAQLVVNDDARMALHGCLRRLEFVLVWVDGPIRLRGDPSQPEVKSPHDLIIDRSACDTVLDNSGDRGALALGVRQLVDHLFGERRPR